MGILHSKPKSVEGDSSYKEEQPPPNPDPEMSEDVVAHVRKFYRPKPVPQNPAPQSKQKEEPVTPQLALRPKPMSGQHRIQNHIQAYRKRDHTRVTKPPPWQIFVKTLTGRTITIDNMYPETTLEELASRIQEIEGTPLWAQKLSFRGKQLDFERTLGMYGIGDESTVHIVFPLKGD